MHCWKQLSLGWVDFQKYTTFFQNEPLCNDWAKFTSYSSRLKRIYNLHENPFLHVNVFGTPEYQKKWWGKLFLMRIIRPPPPRSWLGLTNVPKIGGDQSPRPHMFRWTWFAWGCQWMAIYLQHKTKRPRESVNWSKFYGWRHKHFSRQKWNFQSFWIDFCTWRFQFEFLESNICFWFQTFFSSTTKIFSNFLAFSENPNFISSSSTIIGSVVIAKILQ